MNNSAATVLVTGNTYPVKDSLRAMGGRWDAANKGWLVPAAKAEEARKLVAGAPRKAFSRTSSGSRRDEFAPVRGCATCRSLGRMCRQCRFDEYDF